MIEVRYFQRYAPHELSCWSEQGDKLAALALANHYMETEPRSPNPSAAVLRYLSLASANTCRSEPSAAFCGGVAHAIYQHAQYRRLQDDEYFALLERARQLGMGRAAYDLAGVPIPELID